MARPLELKASKDSESGKWRVNVPPRLSSSTRRERRFFDTLGEAKGFIEELKTRRDNTAAAPQLSVSQLLDASAAFELLSGAYPDVTLLSAVQSFIAAETQRGRSITVAELFDRFRSARETKSLSYKRDLRWARDRMAPFMNLVASDITPVQIAQALTGLPTSSRNNVLRVLRALFRYAHDLDWVRKVPVRRNDFVTIKRQEVEVLPIKEIRQLLSTALEHLPELLPLLLAQTFAGIRPAEAARLEWNDIDLLRGKITVRAAISKTSSSRSIILAPCALAWFGCCPIGSGLIAPYPAHTLRWKMRKLRRLAGYRGPDTTHWRPGSLRDAFCSYHVTHYGDVSRLTLEAGHASLQITKNHYLGLTTSEAAREFWNLLPQLARGTWSSSCKPNLNSRF